jgi:hypothetical protein
MIYGYRSCRVPYEAAKALRHLTVRIITTSMKIQWPKSLMKIKDCKPINVTAMSGLLVPFESMRIYTGPKPLTFQKF